MRLPLIAMLLLPRLAWSVQLPPTEPVFNVIGVEQGMPSAQTAPIVEDALGRIWVGTTNGLARLDGHSIRTFVADVADPHALVSNSVDALSVDHIGRVWVATQGGHVARHRIDSDDFERIDWGGADIAVWALAPLGDDMLLGTMGKGVLRLDMRGQTSAIAEMSANNVLNLYADSGSVWLGSLTGELWHIDGTSAQRITGPPEDQVLGLNARNGVAHFTTADGRYCTARSDGSKHCESVPEIARPGRLRMVLPLDDSVWLGGDGELLHWPESAKPQRIPFRPGAIGGIPSQGFWAGYADRSGNIWLSTRGGGLLQWSTSARRFSVWAPDVAQDTGYNVGRVRGIARRPGGELLLATFGAGLIEIDFHGRAQSVAIDGLNPRVWALNAKRDQLWVGHHDGLTQVSDNQVRELLADGMVDIIAEVNGALWAARTGNDVNRIDSGGATRYAFGERGLRGLEIQQIAAGADGSAWFASDAGLFRYDGQRDLFEVLLAGNVDAFSLGRLGIHVFVDGELRRFRWHAGLLQDETFAPRRFSAMQSVGALHDDGYALWLMGPQGLLRWDIASDSIEMFDRRDGLTTRELSDRPAFVDRSGVFVGSEQGAIHFDPDAFRKLPEPSTLRFDAIRIATVDANLVRNGAQSVAIDAKHRSIEIDVRLDTLDRAHGQRFAFRLLPRDADWPMHQASPTLNLGVLPSSDYTLRVRAIDGYGQPARNELSLPIAVAAPPWRSWAMLASAFALCALFWSYAAWLKRRENARAALRDAQQQALWAQQLAAEKGALVAELSHEIRNPLNGMLGMARLLSSASLPPSNMRHVELLNAAGTQLVSLLDNVLDWSRVDAQADSLTLQSLDVGRELSAQIEHYGHLAQAKGLAFDAVVESNLVVLAAAARLRQIVENLLSNAIKYTARGSVRLSAVGDGNMAAISVTDTGPGLSAEQAAQLFKPFIRGAGERLAPGTGLGLVLSKRLAERMGRSLIPVPQAAPASFQLRLPLARTSPAYPEEATPAPAAPLLGMRLLLVEDDPIAREATEAELRAQGASVQSAPDALAALSTLMVESVDAALLDWDLPGMSGMELADVMRTQHPAVRLLAVTARATPEDRANAKARGFEAHISKPIKIAELIAALTSGHKRVDM